MRFCTKKLLLLTVTFITISGAAMFATSQKATAQEYFIGELRTFGFGFCPRDWVAAEGQLLPIAQNSALFSLYGTYYGGDGRTTFGLPDLRGRTPIHNGNGPGLPNYNIGQRGGQVDFTLTINQLPSHDHQIGYSTDTGPQKGPSYSLSAEPTVDESIQAGPGGNTGGGQPVSHRSPYLAVTWCVAINGLYPSRS